MKHVLNVLIITTTLGGCAGKTIKDVKENGSISERFTANENYQAIYKDMLAQSKACYSGNAITATTQAEGNIYAELGEADIEVSLDGVAGRAVHMVIEFKKLESTSTNVSIYAYYSTWKSTVEKVKGAILNKSPLC